MERNNYISALTTKGYERAKERKMPVEATVTQLENNWDTVIPYGDLLIVAGYAGELSGNNVFAATYKVLEHDMAVMYEISPQLFEDEGHAVRWALERIYS